MVCRREHNTMGFLTLKEVHKVNFLHTLWMTKANFDFLNDDLLQRKERSFNPWIIVQQKTKKTLLQNMGAVH